MTRRLVVFSGVEGSPMWRAVRALDAALTADDPAAVEDGYLALAARLIEGCQPDLPAALATALLECSSPLSRMGARAEPLPAGLRAAARADIAVLAEAARRDWRAASVAHPGAGAGAGDGWPAPAAEDAPASLPVLERLAHRGAATPWSGAVAEIASLLLEASATEALEGLLRCYERSGVGPAARNEALRWHGGTLQGVAEPATADAAELVGVDEPLRRLFANTEAFLAGAPAHNVLLYGPRGSGKSTAVRSLLARYGSRGLRLVELPADALEELPLVLDTVRGLPQRFVLYVDDLSFEQGDARYHPLKTLLEGGLTRRPANVVVYATSNRRHLLRERFSDRPDAGADDDVHAWDTHNEHLALADRFGLTLTFPSATQQGYLQIVSALAAREGVVVDELEARALRFAQWGNGYSGRTARQFVDALRQEGMVAPG